MSGPDKEEGFFDWLGGAASDAKDYLSSGFNKVKGAYNEGQGNTPEEEKPKSEQKEDDTPWYLQAIGMGKGEDGKREGLGILGNLLGGSGLTSLFNKGFKMGLGKSLLFTGIIMLLVNLAPKLMDIFNPLSKNDYDFNPESKVVHDETAGTKNQFTDATNAQITFVEKDVNGNVIAGPDVTKQLAELKAKQLGSEERLDAVKQEELEVHNE